MGQSLVNASDMIAYAGDLRRASQQAKAPALAQKLSQSARVREKAALQQVSMNAPGIGALLDRLA